MARIAEVVTEEMDDLDDGERDRVRQWIASWWETRDAKKCVDGIIGRE